MQGNPACFFLILSVIKTPELVAIFPHPKPYKSQKQALETCQHHGNGEEVEESAGGFPQCQAGRDTELCCWRE